MTRLAIPLVGLLLATCPVVWLRTVDGQSAQPAQTSPGGQRLEPTRLRVEGTSFWTQDGRSFEWRGISAFRLTEMVAHGREREAVAFLDWAAAQKLTVVRVFVMAHHLFQLKAESGVAALPRLLELAADRGLYVEAVALVDTKALKLDFAQHMKAVGPILAAHANSILEVANEPWHSTQDPRLHDPAEVKKLAELVPAVVPVALGSAEGHDGYAAGDFVTWHSPRASGDGGWEHVLASAAGAALLTKWEKPVISDEPIGAAAERIPGRRDDSPERFGALAAVSRLAGLGASFHYEGGLHARIPSGAELACFEAWRSGLDLLDALPRGGSFVTGAGLDSTAKVQGARSVVARHYGKEVWIIAVDPTDATSVEWLGQWQQKTARNSPGVRLFHAHR